MLESTLRHNERYGLISPNDSLFDQRQANLLKAPKACPGVD